LLVDLAADAIKSAIRSRYRMVDTYDDQLGRAIMVKICNRNIRPLIRPGSPIGNWAKSNRHFLDFVAYVASDSLVCERSMRDNHDHEFNVFRSSHTAESRKRFWISKLLSSIRGDNNGLRIPAAFSECKKKITLVPCDSEDRSSAITSPHCTKLLHRKVVRRCAAFAFVQRAKSLLRKLTTHAAKWSHVIQH